MTKDYFCEMKRCPKYQVHENPELIIITPILTDKSFSGDLMWEEFVFKKGSNKSIVYIAYKSNKQIYKDWDESSPRLGIT